MKRSTTVQNIAGLASLSLAVALSSPASAGVAACASISGNLIHNCGFETGDSTDWGTINAAIGSDQGISTNPESGDFGWKFGATDPHPPHWDILYQIIPTTPGTKYDVNYFWASDGELSNLFFAGYQSAPFTPGSGITVDTFLGTPLTFYTDEDFSFVATASSSSIYFGGWDVPGFQYLDDVSVTRAPEPLTLSVFGVGLVGAASLRRRKNVKG